MTTTLRFFAILALSAWLGGSFLLMFFVAPDVFRLLPTAEQAGAVVGRVLTRLHLIALACAFVFLACNAWLLGSARALARPAALLVFTMALLTAGSQYGVTPRMEALRQEMVAAHGSIEATPRTSPERIAFGRLHGVSAGLELIIFVLGLVAMFLTVRQFGADPGRAS